MKEFKDQLNRTIHISFPPKRIISLVPSQTELLFHLGLEEEVVGITKFCVHPKAQFKVKTKVGGTKTLKFDKIDALKPELILANKEENDKEQIEMLAAKYPVWISDVKNLAEGLDMIALVGEMTGKLQEANDLVENIGNAFSKLKNYNIIARSAVYFIWRKPYMVAGGGTFIHDMMEQAGFHNIYKNENRYPEISLEELAKHAPEVILLASEPFPFKEKHVAEFRLACPDADIQLVDGEIFSWYGSRLLLAASYFTTLQKSV